MEAIRQTIDSNLLGDIITLPKYFQNKKVEVIVFLTEEKTSLPVLSKDEIDAMLRESITESLIGILPPSDMTIEDYRLERLGKYELTD